LLIYADTSFLISLYGQDANSTEAQRMAADLQAPFAFTPLHRHEARNAVRLAVFREDITNGECEAVLAAMEQDEKAGVLARSPVAWAEVFDQAEALSAAHTAGVGTRAMDILHVAAATTLGSEDFFTFDARQKTLAGQAGLNVRPE